jgi:hypothetical protein
MATDARLCPFCAEEIKAAAIVCKHCGRDVVPEGSAAGEGARPDLTEAQAGSVAKHGIEWHGERWMFKGNHFRSVDDAIAMAESWGGLEPVKHVASKAGGVRWWMIAAFLVLAFLAWATLRTPSAEETERYNARAAIELCWSEQAKKSLEPGEARFVAGACELMEKRFRERFGAAP